MLAEGGLALSSNLGYV